MTNEYEELRKGAANAIAKQRVEHFGGCFDQEGENAGDVDACTDGGCWCDRQTKKDADNVFEYLQAAGLALVPREATEVMVRSAERASAPSWIKTENQINATIHKGDILRGKDGQMHK